MCMRAIHGMMGLLLMPFFQAMAEEAPKEVNRLMKLELELGLKKAAGYGDKHPAVVRLNTSIAMIEKRKPDVRNKAYVELLKGNRNRLEDQQALITDEGLGDNNPGRREINQQLAAINRRLDALKGK